MWLALISNEALLAQHSTATKHRVYKVTATTVGSTVTGYLASVSDSSIFVTPISFKGSGISSGVNYQRIDYPHLLRVRIRRKGSTGRAVLTGSLAGIVLGAVGGLADGSDYKNNQGGWCILCMTAGEKAAIYGTTGGLAGAIIGTFVGVFAHKTFNIGGRKERFASMKSKLIK